MLAKKRACVRDREALWGLGELTQHFRPKLGWTTESKTSSYCAIRGGVSMASTVCVKERLRATQYE